MAVPDQQQALLSLLTETNLDLRSWRERNWVAFRDSSTGIFGLASLSVFREEAIVLAFVGIIGVAVAAHVYLRKNFERYSENVEARSNIERALGLYADGAFIPGKALLPAVWARPKGDKRGTNTFIALIWMFALLTGAAIGIRIFLA